MAGSAGALAVVAGLAGCGGNGGSIAVSPGSDGPIDAPVHVVVSGQEPGSLVTVGARARYLGGSWASSARFRVGPSGTVDLDTAAPESGSYSGADGMGLFWSLAQVGGPTAGSSGSADLGAPEQVTLSVGGRHAARSQVVRRMETSPTTSVRLRPGGAGGRLYADFLRPARASGKLPAVVIIGGAEGGLATGLPVADALASHGMAVLDLAYFAAPGLPPRLADIPLEYFADAVGWLRRQPGVDPARLYLYGVSRGTEAALLTASYYPSLVSGVAAMVPTDAAFCGAPACTGPAWTFGGRGVPFTRQLSEPTPSDVPAALIPITRFGGRVLLVCAGHDQRWSSCPYSARISSELADAGRPLPELLSYPDAGHGAGFPLPYLPELETPGLAGVTPAANPHARAAAWPLLLAFLTEGDEGGEVGAARARGGGAAAPEYRSVLLDGRPVACARVFRTDAAKEHGLSGQSAPAAGAFVNQPPAQPALWMRDTRRDLVGVWVGPDASVLGSVRMQAMTLALHPAPRPVPLILELAPAVWARSAGARTATLAGRCGAR